MPLDTAAASAPAAARPQEKLRQFSRETAPTGVERLLKDNELIVSKTDTKGVITYANETFMRMAGMTEQEACGAPHSIIRHPDMPRAVFKFLWDRISSGHEVFAYVVNLAKGGDHYWVLAHVTPTYDSARNIVGYHSNRRKPRREAVDAVVPLYAKLREIERNAASKAAGCDAALAYLTAMLEEKGATYDEFIFSI